MIGCIRDSISIAIPEPTERQHIGDQIDAAFIFARADFRKRDVSAQVEMNRIGPQMVVNEQ